jgi:hypothetical protein
MTAPTLYKFTNADGSSAHGGHGKWHLGRWRSVSGPLVPCRRGLHLCREQNLMLWLAPALWEAEADGEVIEAADKVVARRARIVRRVEAWNDRTARLFAADCAEHLLPLFEADFPTDDRPRKAIETARRFADGKASREEMAAAQAAAGAAAWDAAWDAARAAAWDAAQAAARAAARVAAWAAAWAAARAAARDAAWAAAWAAECEWQTARLMAYIRGEIA